MTNPVLHKLGLSANARVFVFHADDIGMCHASVAAYDDLLAHSPLSAASTMVPCPWFPAAARLFRMQADHPRLDVGVHLTLTSEWDAFRWGPVSPAGSDSSLLDDEGYFHRGIEPVQASADIAAVETELRAQIARAQAAGIDITHLDTHMGTLVHPRFLALYAQLGLELGVPSFALRTSAADLAAAGVPAAIAEQMGALADELEAQGMPLFDSYHVMPLGDALAPAARLDHARRQLDATGPGLHYFILHPSADTPELRALAPDWEARVGDYGLFMSDAWHQAVATAGVHVIGMKRLRHLMAAPTG